MAEKKESKKITPEDLDGSIERRHKSQLLLLRVYRFLDRTPTFTKDESVPHDMVGVGFSLWRAAFLVHAERADNNIRSSAKETLRKLLEQNSFSFGDELQNCHWMVGYYLNDAQWRVTRILDKLSKAGVELKDKQREISFGKLSPGLSESECSPKSFWDTIYGAADEIASAIAIANPEERGNNLTE